VVSVWNCGELRERESALVEEERREKKGMRKKEGGDSIPHFEAK
jgi:hypothetical protein